MSKDAGILTQFYKKIKEKRGWQPGEHFLHH